MPPLLRLSRFACWANCLVGRASPASPAATTLRQRMVAFPCGGVPLAASLLLLYPISGAFVKGLAGISPGNHPYYTPFFGDCQALRRGCSQNGFSCVVSDKGIHQPPLFGAQKGLFAGRIPPLPYPLPPCSRGERAGVRGDSSSPRCFGVFGSTRCTLISHSRTLFPLEKLIARQFLRPPPLGSPCW
jgi:hypothetical protein